MLELYISERSGWETHHPITSLVFGSFMNAAAFIFVSPSFGRSIRTTE